MGGDDVISNHRGSVLILRVLMDSDGMRAPPPIRGLRREGWQQEMAVFFHWIAPFVQILAVAALLLQGFRVRLKSPKYVRSAPAYCGTSS